MAAFPAAQTEDGLPKGEVATPHAKAAVLVWAAPSGFAMAAAVGFQRPAEAVAAELVVSLPLPLALVVAGLPRSGRLTRRVAPALVASLLAEAAPACPPQGWVVTWPLALALVVTSPLVVEAKGFSQAAGPTQAVLAHESGFATRSRKRASMPSVGRARSPAKSAHRTYLASGESDRESGKAGRQTRVPQRGRRRQRAQQSLLHQFARHHPAQKKMEPFRSAGEATWHAERTPAPRSVASFRRWREEVRRRRGSTAVFEVASGGWSSRSWQHALKEF